ncbi:heat shock 70 kDa protein-like [Zophobas morio]|uniref:heat shock 70 kDa protein-like n=1 Tax=Zophobas morio TaxID=2755281 RepID=UPI0030827224
MNDLAIGIDLGTTNSCISVYTKGRTRILENERGGRVTPSFIYFQPQGSIFVGEHAKSMSVQKPENGIYEVKRLLGRQFDDTYIQISLQFFPFVISSGVSNRPVISFEQNNRTIEKTPQELCTIILQRLKKYAEAKLNQTVNKAVITVPAYFNVTQREVTLAGAKDAGFTVLKLLNEPTAAALAYYFNNNITENHISLVYDFGGGTFDVAILQKKIDNVEVLSVGGDTQLGGHDLDNCILDYIFEVLRKHYNYDATMYPDDKRRLRIKCEEAKKELSWANEAVITINGMVAEHPRIIIKLTKTLFEEKTDKLFKKTIDILHNCLADAKISRELIQEVILCGGSTRIPKIQEMLSDYFGGKQLNKFVNPDECVAEGAALQAAMLSTSKTQNIEQLHMVDVVPLSLGFDSFGHAMQIAIHRNTKIPAKGFWRYVNKNEDDTSSTVRIYEGERTDTRKNRYLGILFIDGLTPAPPGQRHVTFILNIDNNGILTARAEEELSNNVREVKVNYTRGDRSEFEIKNSLLAAAENQKIDEKFKNFVKIKKYVNQYLRSFLYNLHKRNLGEEYQSIQIFCEETKYNLDYMEVDQEKRVKDLYKEMKMKCDPIAERHNFDYMPKYE